MQFAIVFAALFAAAMALPQARHNNLQADIVKAINEADIQSFHYVSETSDGSSQQASGQLKQLGPDDFAIVQQGQFSYVGDDGQTYTIKWIADENGFQPQGAHLPVAVEV